jgi:2-haloacid dehalogenase
VPRPTAVVFDLGGVLVDWNPRYLFRQLLPDDATVEWFLAEVCTAEWNAAQDAGRTWDQAVAEASARFPDHAEFVAAYHERWGDTIAGQLDDTVGVLADLRATGVGLFALTNWSADKFDLTVKRFDWLSWFDGIVVSGRERIVKPDPRIYRVLLERYCLEPARTVYIDDVLVNVEAAREIGMISLHFVGADRLRADLRNLRVPIRMIEGREVDRGHPADPAVR